ncbi:hypothetical protein OH76DRAFT_1400371 [Lentinus brumalis]|uniref:F-box domain-containing protein n=1 Tax=Lentinus brumalis TaxID=2498619 RepID=A0A371DJ73_9APHY|nr:hypothetical protein OH76DRAFT_1400371 [Polyporus brumalis]
MTPTTLVDLPVELLSCIFLHLDFRDVLRCRGVCSSLKDFVDDDSHMRYKIELAVAGMKDGVHSTLTVSDRLSMLELKRDAWRKLAWTSQKDIPATRNSASWELCGGVFAEEENRRTLHFWQLPSQIRGIQWREWTLNDVGVSMSDFGIDPAQDLLVIAEDIGSLCRMHLRSMTTGMVHPMSPPGGVLVHWHEPEHAYSIQISNDHLAVLLTDHRSLDSELVVWNWKTGAVLLLLTDTDVLSFVFLTSTYILLLAFGEPTEDDVGTNHIGPGSNLCLLVIDLDRTRPERVRVDDLDFLCAFLYPDLHDRCNVIDMVLCAAPGPAWTPSSSLQVPFSISGEDRLLVVTLKIAHGVYWEVSTLTSFIPSETLLSAVKSLPSGQTGRVFAWEDWGVYGSRLEVAPQEHLLAMPCYVHGTSFARHIQESTQPLLFPFTIEVFDFNPLALRRALLSSQAEGGSSGYQNDAAIVATSTTLTGHHSTIFNDEVTTYYPYFRRAVEIPGRDEMEQVLFDALLLEEDSLILVSSESVNSNPFYRILTF